MQMPFRFFVALTLLISSAVQVVQGADDARATEEKVSYYRHVRPILQRHCSGCHQPAKLGGNLQLISFELFQKGGDTGPSYLAGKPDESLIVKNISGDKPTMPLNADPLSKKQIDTIRNWIAQGATTIRLLPPKTMSRQPSRRSTRRDQ
jgi:mono/diheme cytochrome c family protein